LRRIDLGDGHPLDLDPLLADNPRWGFHGSQCSSGPGGSLNVEKGDCLPIRGKGGVSGVAHQLGETPGRAGNIQAGKVNVLLPGRFAVFIDAFGEKRQSHRVRRPGDVTLAAICVGSGSRGNPLALA
jgi:hypothetical protein